jgi:hypothetical protein
MKKTAKFGIALCLAGGLSFGATWSAELMDASCYDSQKTAHTAQESLEKTCVPTAATTNFAMRTSSGKVYKVDASGNSELASDIQKGTLKARKSGEMHATINGKLKDGVVNVNSVNLSK